MGKRLILFITCLTALFTAYSQNTSTAYTNIDSLVSLRNKTALAVVYTMYYQDSVLAIQGKEIGVWQDRYARQKQYSDSCDAVKNNCMQVVHGLNSDNKQLKSCLKQNRLWLKISGIVNLVLITALIL
jgi:hypothetical protein